MADVNLTRKVNAKKLAEGYTATKRAMEMTSIALFAVLWTLHFVGIARYFVHHGPPITTSSALASLISAFLGFVLADFVSGLVHWGFDTWGSPSTPVVGSFIRSFREHHVDQMAITRHDIIETNGDSCLPVVPVLAAVYFFAPNVNGSLPGVVGYLGHPALRVFLVSLSIAVALTNQFHKFSHQPKLPGVVSFLMRNRLILSSQAHRVHHSGEFEKHYCITTGWLNVPLDYIGFWRRAEAFITATTGAIPRDNDKQVACFESAF